MAKAMPGSAIVRKRLRGPEGPTATKPACRPAELPTARKQLMTQVNVAKEAHQLAAQTSTEAKVEQAVNKNAPTSCQAKARSAIADQQA